MTQIDAAKYAGNVLRKLINENYPSQEEFAYDYGIEIRTVSRYVNIGITKIPTLQELALFFDVSIKDFLPD